MSAQRCPLCGAGFLSGERPPCACATGEHSATPNPVFGQVAAPGESVGAAALDDLRLFEVTGGQGGGHGHDVGALGGEPFDVRSGVGGGHARRVSARRGPWLLVGAVAVGLGAAGAVAVASGVFNSGTGPSRTVSTADGSTLPIPTGGASTRAADPSPENAGGPDARASVDPSSTATGTSSASPAPAGSAEASAPSAPARAASGRPPASSSVAPPAPGSRVLSTGSHGGQVKNLQRRLGRLNLYTGPPDGNYTSEVADAVRRYQVARGIDEEAGVYGPATRAALESETN